MSYPRRQLFPLIVILCLTSLPPFTVTASDWQWDTEGRVTWNEPSFETWHGTEDVYRMMKEWEKAKALIVCWHQTEPGTQAGAAVYARQIAPKRRVYLTTNRPDEVRQCHRHEVVLALSDHWGTTFKHLRQEEAQGQSEFPF